MVAVQHPNPSVRSRMVQLCAQHGRIAISLETVPALQEFLRFNSVALILIDGEASSAQAVAVVQNLRADIRTAHTPILWFGDHFDQQADSPARPDAIIPPQDLAKVEETLVALLETKQDQELEGSFDSGSQTRILLIDDSLTYRMTLREALVGAGYEVTLAPTGEAGLEEAFKQNFSAAMVDNMLPGIQGADVIRRIRSEAATRRLPCLLLTASEDPDSELAALEAGADSFIRKDETTENILLRLATVVRTASAPSAFRYAPSTTRRVLLAGKPIAPTIALREMLLADGIVVVDESDLDSIFERAAKDSLDAVVLTMGHVDALRLCRKLKESPRSARMRVLVMECNDGHAAVDSGEAQAAALQAGADDFLSCTLPAPNLRARLVTQLRRKQMEDENRALNEHVLRHQVEAETQRKLAAERAVHTEELLQAKDLVEVEARDKESARLQLEKVIEGVPQIVFMATADGELITYNQRYVQYTGSAPPNETLEMWRTLMPAEDFERYLFIRTSSLDTGAPFDGEFRLRSKAGEYRWFFIQASPMAEAAKARRSDAPRWLATCTDIHDRKLSEEALRRTEKLAATGRLAASIAHEINNPLEAVTNLLFLIELGTAGQAVHEYAVSAQQEIGRVSEIAKKTLTFYRETKDPAPVDIAALLEETRDVYATRLKQKNMTMEMDVRTEKRPRGLSGELRQVVNNLVSNAIDASPLKSILSVRVRDTRHPVTGREGIRIMVCDRGTGIPQRLRDDLFKPFITTKGQNGTGLGLWVAQSIAARHEGDLRFWSSDRGPHTGTCFAFFLPLDGKVLKSEDSIGEMMKQIGSELVNK